MFTPNKTENIFDLKSNLHFLKGVPVRIYKENYEPKKCLMLKISPKSTNPLILMPISGLFLNKRICFDKRF